MADVIDRKSVITSFEADTKGLEKGAADSKKLVNGVQEVSKKSNEALKSATANVKQLAVEQLKLGDTIRESLGPVGGIVARIGSAFLGLISGIRNATIGVRAFTAALITTGVGALVVALGALAAAFFSTERGGDALQQQLTRVKVIFDSLLGALQDASFKVVDWFKALFENPVEAIKELGATIQGELIERFQALISIGPAVVKLFSKDWKEGLSDIGDAFLKVSFGVDNLGAAFNKAIDTADRLFEAQEKLEEQEKRLALTIARLGSAYQDAREDAIDVELSIEKRLAANARAQALNLQIADKQIEVERTKLEIQKLQNSTSDTSVKLQQAELDTQAKIETLQNQARRENERFKKQAIRLEKERIALIKESRELELTAFTEIATGQLVTLERQLTALKTALLDALTVDDQEAAKGIKLAISKIQNEINAFKIKAGDEDAISEYFTLSEKAKQEVKENLDKFISGLKENLDNEFKQKQEAREKEKAADEKAATDKEENINRIKTAATGALQSLADLNQQQIDQVNQAISIQTERVSRYEELAKTGSARQLIIEEERLDKMETIRNEALAKQRRLAQAQMLINQAITVSESVKAIAQAFGTPGPLGIVAGVAMSAALALSIASMASNIGGLFGSIPAFAKGTEVIQGPGTGTSDSIMARLSKGERVTDASTNKKVNSVARGVFPNRLLPDAVRAYMSTPEITAAMQNMAVATEKGFKEMVEEQRNTRVALQRLKVSSTIRDGEFATMVSSYQQRESWRRQ